MIDDETKLQNNQKKSCSLPVLTPLTIIFSIIPTLRGQ